MHLYSAGTFHATVDGVPVDVDGHTGYPWDGRIAVTVTTNASLTLSSRVPGWATEARLDGTPAEARDGYARVRRDWSRGATVTLDLPMPARVR